MENDNNSSSLLPLNTFSEIPKPSADARRITGLVKQSGRITGYRLSDNSRVTKSEGVALARNNGIAGVGIATRNGVEYLKALPDSSESNNLGSLPTVSD